MKNTTSKQAKQAKNNKQSAIVEKLENLEKSIPANQSPAYAESMAITDNPPAMESQETPETPEENPSLEDERAARLTMVADQVATYDGKPLSVQLAEWKFAFDAAKSQAGKFPNKTGESELSAKEFIQALLNHCTLDGIHPTTDFQTVCKAIADKRERPLTPEEKVKIKQSARQSLLDELLDTKLSVDKVNRLLALQGQPTLTTEETALFA